MLTRRILPVSVILALVLALFASLSVVSAQEEEEEETLPGSITFRDENALSDSVVIALTDVPAPAAGTAYEGWLIGSSGKVSVGILTVSTRSRIDHTYTDPNGANLLAIYSQFAISSEPVSDPDPATPGPILYSDVVPGGAFVHVGHLVVSWPSNPDGKGIAVGLREQAAVALTHALLAQNSDTLAAKQLHAHHVVNIVEGSGGANFDGSFGNPGDGFGVLNYANDAIVHANLAMEAAPSNETVVAHATGVIDTATNVITWATQARDNALNATNQTVDIVVELAIQNTVASATRALEGRDGDDDGVIEAIANEGGAEKAYMESQDIAEFVLTPGPPGQAPPTGDALVPQVALGVLLAGVALVLSGGFLMLWRRRTVQV